MKIADRIKPIGLDSVGFLKNFRGEVTIDLKDVKTGEVETYHNHNLVTKALGYFLKQGGLSNPSAFNASALRTDFIHYMLGGMMCLDTAITDAGGHDDEIVRVPAGVGMTANGAYNIVNTGNPPELGSWNELESGWQNDGSYKMVWDFTTSQGNGTIATVCLTSLFRGYSGIGNKSNTLKIGQATTLSTYNSIFGKGTDAGAIVGYNDNTMYMLDRDFTGKTTVTLRKYRFPLTDFDVRSTMSAELLEEKTLNLPANMQNLQPASGNANVSLDECFIKNGKAYFLVGRHAYYDNRVAGDVYIGEFDIATEQITNSWVVDVTSQEAMINMTGVSDQYAVVGLRWVDFRNQAVSGDITDGAGLYLGASSQDHQYLETINTNIFEFSGRHQNSQQAWGYASGILDITTSKLLPENGTGDKMARWGGFLDNNNLLKISSTDSTGYIYRDPRYIATIFNLDSAKTKSADKTMKVTYVLRFNEEEGE